MRLFKINHPEGTMRAKKLAALFVAVVMLVISTGRAVQADDIGPPNVLIAEIQTGTVQAANQEFVELYNPGDISRDMTGWRLEYKSATGASWTMKADLSGMLAPHSVYLISTADYLESQTTLMAGLSAEGGHIRLSGLEGSRTVVHDVVGWGMADSAPGAAAPAPAAGQSIQRCFTGNETMQTSNNSVDFKQYPTASPGQKQQCDITPVPNNSPGCVGILFSEVLPNPDGADTQNEFIELYNPTALPVSLQECKLQLDDSIYTLSSSASIPSGSYLLLYSHESGISLPNTAGGTMHLLSSAGELRDSVIYPPSLDMDVAWMRTEDGWKLTYTPTPGFPNILQSSKPCPPGQDRNEETGRCKTPDTPAALCAPGQVRNLETNRCKGTATVTAELAPCPIGQQRNPTTNRCRSTVLASTTLVPCKEGQERSPETNRCRTSATSSNMPTPCSAGQERNPETNRCRKVASTTKNPATIHDVRSASIKNTIGWWVAGVVASVALGYAAYEWRREIVRLCQRLARRSAPRPPQ